ncbi:conjugal transfer protein TraR [Nocardioides gansuensis]|uniref:Conjugal transfer protein TraR n=1 Tax=Nocardioides gansuensis TaxID=2138300 RepID=A0A2T8F6Z5_9ACTN|nr:TraR/DksA family transcriptional regulator [Nocardioides gansuensis]PVG81475.1 conjugal transfer protein TraR [Nocardioides gansuensis]
MDQLSRLHDAPAASSDAARDEIDAALREAAQAVLTLINAALRRIEQGSYGRCQGCGAIMSRDRLAALPMSIWCGSCQLAQEKAASKQRHALSHCGERARDL